MIYPKGDVMAKAVHGTNNVEDAFPLEEGFEIKRELRVCRVPYAPQPVVRGLWHFYSTQGFPLSESFAKALDRNLYPDWSYLVVEMCVEGWSGARIKGILLSEMEGVYPPGVAASIHSGLERLCADSVGPVEGIA